MHIHVCVHVFIYLCVHVYVYALVCLCVCVCVSYSSGLWDSATHTGHSSLPVMKQSQHICEHHKNSWACPAKLPKK